MTCSNVFTPRGLMLISDEATCMPFPQRWPLNRDSTVVTNYFSSTSTGQYFKRYLPLANGIVTAGSGIGTLAMGPLYHVILSKLGWKIMLRILCGLGIVMFLSALLYRPLPEKYKRAQKEPSTKSKLFDISVWKMKPFVVWVISMSLLFIGYFVPFIHLVSTTSFVVEKCL